MTTHRLNPGSRKFFWWPFWGLPAADTVPDIAVGPGPWVPMQLDAAFVLKTPVEPGARWFRVFLAHPTAPAHPDAIVVPPDTSPLRFRVAGAPEIDALTVTDYIAAPAT